MPVLLFPGALAALAALAVPLLVHLARRDALRPVDFAALRWLEAKRRPRAQWRLDEWLLLLVRLLLLALVALWLARPALEGGGDTTPWVALVPGIDVAQVTATGRRHWLAPGFPALNRPVPAGPLPVASLLRQLDAELPPGTPLTVAVPATIQGADAERPRLSRAVTWRIVPGTMPTAVAVADPVPRLTVRYAPGRAGAVRYLRAAAIAWQPPGSAPLFDAALLTAPLPTNPVALAWLAPEPLPVAAADWVRRGGTALVEGTATATGTRAAATPATATVVWRDPVGTALITSTPLGRGRILRLTRRLDAASLPQLLDPDFPARLRALFAAPRPSPTRVAAADFAPLTGGASYQSPARDVGWWLALAIAGVFLAERALATARRGRAAP